MLRRDLVKYRFDYTILLILGVIFGSSFLFFRHSPRELFLSTCLFAFCYFLWGIWHHAHLGQFLPRLVLEYFLVAFLGVAIVSTLLI